MPGGKAASIGMQDHSGSKNAGRALRRKAGRLAIQDQHYAPGREHLVNAAALKTMG